MADPVIADPKAEASPGEGGEFGSSPEPSSSPSVADRLAMSEDERKALPDDQRAVSLDDLATHVQESNTVAVAAAHTAERKRAADQAAVQADTDRANVDKQQDANYANELDKRLEDVSETVREEAKTELAGNRDRYGRGLSFRKAQTREVLATEILTEHYNPMLEALRSAGHEVFTDNLTERVAQHGQNFLLAAVEYGKSLSTDAAYARGKEEAERDARIKRGQDGAPEGSNGRGGDPRGADSYDLSKPGEGRKMAVDAIRVALKTTS
ncbi:hypothetical protein LCGC14_1939320 [marine sediment metagenome]|uniref:Uncharacterized protein n=1 Tax=marine sediment metagenome TaxID=412755 RepID=A0A0F9FKQ7_9ZZZZ